MRRMIADHSVGGETVVLAEAGNWRISCAAVTFKRTERITLSGAVGISTAFSALIITWCAQLDLFCFDGE